jgi:hypothetical protein
MLAEVLNDDVRSARKDVQKISFITTFSAYVNMMKARYASTCVLVGRMASRWVRPGNWVCSLLKQGSCTLRKRIRGFRSMKRATVISQRRCCHNLHLQPQHIGTQILSSLTQPSPDFLLFRTIKRTSLI